MVENKKTEDETTATEIIADLTKKLNTVTADLDYICEEIRQAKAVFSAIRYAINEGGVIDEASCMDGFYNMLDVLLDNVENSCGVCESFVAEVM